MWLWIDLLFLSLFFDGALLVKCLVDRDFPIPAAPKETAG